MVSPPLLCSEMLFVFRPTYELLVQAYDDYRPERHPDYGRCPNVAANHCAVRMSVALYRAGSITLEDFGGRADARENRGRGNRVHRGRCGLQALHVPGAQELARHVRTVWSTPCEVYRRGGDAPAAIRARHGIIFFKDCFDKTYVDDETGESTTRRTGDHIDLWDGATFWNVKLGISAGGGVSADAPLFDRAGEVWFMPF